ncbi:MAG: MCE family protein [Alphaproteobacteria bacterium]|nr:MCE family protein [Alphaproteobacteria bacterium]
MKGIGSFETLLSGAVILLAVGFFIFLNWQTGTGSLGSYELAARLNSADGIKPGADVRIAGVKVGSVATMDLVKTGKRYAVDLKLAIRDDIRVPEDSRLVIGGGTLSSTTLSIAPGRSHAMAPAGGTLRGS